MFKKFLEGSLEVPIGNRKIIVGNGVLLFSSFVAFAIDQKIDYSIWARDIFIYFAEQAGSQNPLETAHGMAKICMSLVVGLPLAIFTTWAVPEKIKKGISAIVIDNNSLPFIKKSLEIGKEKGEFSDQEAEGIQSTIELLDIKIKNTMNTSAGAS